MKKYECRTLYPANNASGKLAVISFVCKSLTEDEKEDFIKIQDKTQKIKSYFNALIKKAKETNAKNGWKDNPYNLIGKRWASNIYFFEEYKNEDLILLMSQNTTVDSSQLKKNSIKGIIIDYDETFYEDAFHSSSKHAFIYAREAGIPIVGMKNATKYLVPGQKITIKPRVPIGKIVVE